MTQKSQIKSIAILRPRFKVISQQSIESLVAHINASLKSNKHNCMGQSNEHFTAISIKKDQQNYWSPVLTLTMEKTEKGSLIRGQYGPKPTIWTMFLFFYSAIGFAILFVGMVGLSQVSLNKPSPILWLIPLLILIFLSLYLVAYWGKKKSKNQMHILHQFVEHVLQDTFEEVKE